MAKNNALIQSLAATLKILENQMGQLATKLRSRPQGALPSDIENLRNFSKEYCKVVELRGDKILEPKKDVVEDEPNKLPPKLKDPGSFTIPCNIEKSYCGKALCDLGASINLMPKSIFKLLGIGKVRPTTVTLQLVDRLLAYPEGNIEDVLAMKFPDLTEECSVMEELETLVSMECKSNFEEDLLENTLRSKPFEDVKGNDSLALMEANLRSYDQPLRFKPLELEVQEFTQPKLSIEEPPKHELKTLPSLLKYIYLGNSSTLSVIVLANLT
ncbi:uncharacterized protein [Gossypium hirsutum]|uniref:Aspartic peptidase DDI1-type domain-containing protein n=1 Tax=Gossypium hirsutum TaxID=3635 RepID=A0A1U8KBX4_GOSHI|nr:uncharacterized protein LOC107915327 [Gossypium hirsutum]